MSGTRDAHERYRDRLAPVLDHVREHVAGDLSVEALARAVHFSPYHFHRVFTAVMGETVGTFVRRARLERALHLMRSSPERTLASVALEAGFGSHSDFTRTFRQLYGIVPSRWDRRSSLEFRKNREAAAVQSPYDLGELIASDEGPPVRVDLRRTEGLTLAFVRVRRPFEEGALQRGYERLRRFVDESHFEKGELVGLSWDDVESTPPEQIRYDLACTVPEDVEACDGVGVRTLPPLLVAAAHAAGDLSRVARVWHHLYHDWLPASTYEPFNLPPFEWYRGWPERVDVERWDLDCCIPLRPLEGAS